VSLKSILHRCEYVNFHLKVISHSKFATKPKVKERYLFCLFLHNGYVGMLRSTRGTTEKVAHLKIHYKTAADDLEVRSTDISPVSKLTRYAWC
jgi:hypothetical protein